MLLHRQAARGQVIDGERETAAAEQILQNLLGASAKALARHGGVAGLFLLPDGTPWAMPFQRGVLSLGD